MTQRDPPTPPVKGRGATFNPANRFRADTRERYDDGWPARYAAHRIAWHALDHLWEIEDRSTPEPPG